MARILFIYNGGTIGQIQEIRGGKTILVSPKDSKLFEEACAPIIEKVKRTNNIDFEFLTSKDSTNMTPNDWEKLIIRIKKAQDEENYDAVAIVHGTDTLAYTSTALALALHGKNPQKSGLRIPVCITGGQTPIYEPGGDGRFNLENIFLTLDKAIKLGVADVIINFWNKVYLGCRALKTSERNFDAFDTPAYPEVGSIDARGVTLLAHLMKNKKDAGNQITLAHKFGRGVVSFELSPGLDPSVVLGFITNGGVSAMVFKSLGEGCVCSEGQFNLLPLIKKASEEYKTPIFITTKFIGGSTGGSNYEVSLTALEAGGIACFDQTDIAVDVKVRWLLGNGICSSISDFRKAMVTSYAGEVTENPV